jgi:hypothetical protein
MQLATFLEMKIPVRADFNPRLQRDFPGKTSKTA